MSASVVQVPTIQATNIVPLSTVSTTYTTTQALPTTTILPATTLAQPATIPSVPIVSQDGGPNYEVELKKRLLDGQRELKEKQAEMEADKEKKLEEKADKHRTKAVKWIGRGFPAMAGRHETKATALDVKANEHFMAAEQLRIQAKSIDKERKSYDPPKEERTKKAAAKNPAMKKPAGPADAAPRATTPVAQKTTTSTQQGPAGQTQQRTVQQTRSAAPAPGAAPSLQKEAAPAAPVVQKETKTETTQAAPAEAAPVKQETKTEKTVEEKPAEEAEAAPVVQETKTEKTTETEAADGEKKVEKKEEKHHHLLHKEKHSGTPSH